MKKLIIFLSFLVAYNIGFTQSKVIITSSTSAIPPDLTLKQIGIGNSLNQLSGTPNFYTDSLGQYTRILFLDSVYLYEDNSNNNYGFSNNLGTLSAKSQFTLFGGGTIACSSCTSIGALAGSSSSGIGSQNTSIGAAAGLALGTGSNNINIGYYAGVSATHAISSNSVGSIIIGGLSGVAATGITMTNATLIGNSIVNDSSNIAIFGTSTQRIILGNYGGNTSAMNAFSPALSQIFFNTDSTSGNGGGYCVWNGTKWIKFGSASSASASDTLYAVNGTQALGTHNDSVGIGGTLYHDTHISGSNAYTLYLDSMQLALTGPSYSTPLSVDTTNLKLIVRNTSTSKTSTVSWPIFGGNWTTTGNSGLASFSYFLGNTDNHPLWFRVNNQASGYIDSSGGTGNTLFGYTAAAHATSGTNNTGMGVGVLKSINSSGVYNTAMGFNAMTANTSGNTNVAIGMQSLAGNTSGSNNTAVGYQSLVSNTTGSKNTGVGLASLTMNTTGANNTAVGYNSLSNAILISNNTAVGFYSLFRDSLGGRNIAVGDSALYLATNITNVIGIGNSISSANGVSNTTIIGNDISFTGSNGAILSRTDQHAIIGAALSSQTDNGATLQVDGAMTILKDSLATSYSGTVMAVGVDTSTNKLVKQNVFYGQTTLVSGTKAITLTGITTSSIALVTLVTPSGTTSTTAYQAVCTANTLTIQANVAAGTINASDGSTVNYIVYAK